MPDANLEISARRIMWGKTMNAGQTCLAPDYILCHKSIEKKLIQCMVDVVGKFYPNGSTLESDQFPKLINKSHFDHVKSLLDNTKGTVVYGGETNTDELKIEFTLVNNVDENDSLMQEEVFGPILPIMTFESLDEIPQIIRKKSVILFSFL